MKPHRIRMAHNLILHYGLHNQMEVRSCLTGQQADVRQYCWHQIMKTHSYKAIPRDHNFGVCVLGCLHLQQFFQTGQKLIAQSWYPAHHMLQSFLYISAEWRILDIQLYAVLGRHLSADLPAKAMLAKRYEGLPCWRLCWLLRAYHTGKSGMKVEAGGFGTGSQAMSSLIWRYPLGTSG